MQILGIKYKLLRMSGGGNYFGVDHFLRNLWENKGGNYCVDDYFLLGEAQNPK